MDGSTAREGARSSIDALWTTVVEPVLIAAGPSTVVHVGAHPGEATDGLLGFCARNRALAHLIEPDRTLDPDDLERRYPDSLVWHRGTAMAELGGVRPDLAILESRAGGSSLERTLRLIESSAPAPSAFPVVLVSARAPNGAGGSADAAFDTLDGFLRSSEIELELIEVPDRAGVGVLALATDLEPPLARVLTRFRSEAFRDRVQSRLAAGRGSDRPEPSAADRWPLGPGEADSSQGATPTATHGGPGVPSDRVVALEDRLERAQLENERLKGRLSAAHHRQKELGERNRQAAERLRHWRRRATGAAGRLKGVERGLELRRAELEAARRRLAQSEKKAAQGEEARTRLRSRLEAETANRKRAVAELERVENQLDLLATEAERLSRSRSWRFGHGVMKLLRWATFRPPQGESDAVEEIAARARKARSRVGRERRR